jgi:hypothetical protein
MLGYLESPNLKALHRTASKVPGWLTFLLHYLRPSEVEKLEELDDRTMDRALRQQEKAYLRQAQLKARELSINIETPEWVRPKGHGRIAEEDIQRAREVSMLGLVGADRILCPSHPDRNPSMYVYENGAKCFVCGAYFDTIGWVMKTKGLRFPEAVESLLWM